MKKIIIMLTISVMALGACSSLSSKASKEDVKAGFTKIMIKEDTGLTKAQVTKLSNCVVDKVYDDLSKTSANNMAKAIDKETPEDYDRIINKSKSCIDDIK
ncbi:MAG: hypothetical protein WAU72_06875 [Acidimicrobiia bacterium]